MTSCFPSYRVLEDPEIYSSIVRQRGIHLEQCPFSSVKTGAFDLQAKGWPHHPLATFYRDGVSFSVNTDDPTGTGVFKLEDVTPPNQPTPPTAFTEKDRDLKFGMSVHHEGLFGAIKAIFEFPPLG